MLLTFGIPSLDELVEVPIQGASYEERPSSEPLTESVAILGPDGTGKSVIALHLASRYAADCRRDMPDESITPPPRILYISSDLKLASAGKVWDKFKLCKPNSRRIPFQRTAYAIERVRSGALEVTLRGLSPSNPEGIIDFLTASPAPAVPSASTFPFEIGFLDLASKTAGDDWTFVNALLVKLQSIQSAKSKTDHKELPHLVIIDSVAGFETFVGKFDAYGNEQTRRARIAQCIRNAGTRVNLVFVVEEAHTSEHLPEEYVTDIVLSLRKKTVSASTILTVEVQKARSRAQAKGEHPFEIRSGEGTSTGSRDNIDSPRARNAYVEVFHSLAHRNRLVSAERKPGIVPHNDTVATFGLQYLNDLLYKSKKGPKFGLKAGTATALIGDPATGKSALGERFLAWGFKPMAKDYTSLFLLHNHFDLAKKQLRVRQAFGRIRRELTKSVIQKQKSAPQLPVEWDTSDPGDFSNEWLEALYMACKIGLRATKVDLKKIIKEDFVRRSRGSTVNWDDLTEAAYPTSAYEEEGDAEQPVRALWSGLPPNGRTLFNLFQHPNLRYPGILLTTTDRAGMELAKRCLAQLAPDIDKAIEQAGMKPEEVDRATLDAELEKLFEQQLIVRRFDMHGVPAPAIIHLIHRNIVEANRLIFGVAYPHKRERRQLKCDRIRLVLDDLLVLNKINPEIVEDGGFLSFLTFFLEREGLVSLILHTDEMRPYRVAGNEVSRSLMSVLKRAILTWNVPFEGRHRVAISVMPHNEPDKHGIVRELTIDKDGAPDVTRKLELYAGIEEGKPVQVPLAIYIFNETPQCEAYIETENQMFREVFKPVEGPNPINPGRVIFPIDAQRLLALRDYTHLPNGSQSAHTAVFPVDEYWAQSQPHVLENLYSYLREEFPEEKGNQLNEDPFRLFVGEPLPSSSTSQIESTADEGNSQKPRYSRQNYFINAHYDFKKNPQPATDADSASVGTTAATRVADERPTMQESAGDAKAKIDKTEYRVPFMWDFGFMLVRSGPWEAARDESIFAELTESKFELNNGEERMGHVNFAVPWKPAEDSATPQQKRAGSVEGNSGTRVGEVFQTLIGTDADGVLKQENAMGVTSWRKFFGACNQVAAVHYKQTGATVAPFDIASPSSETINALVLEIWRSEMTLESKIMWGEQQAEKLEKNFQQCPLSLPRMLKHTFDELRDWRPSVQSTETNELLGSHIEKSFETFKSPEASFWAGNPPPAARLERFQKLPLGAFCLYKTWLLLLEALSFEDFLEPGDSFAFRQGRVASSQAIASRQWYKTACTSANELNNSAEIHDALTAVSLPGHYSTRGDWFLGTAKSSRSKLLAQNAIDLLSSRRANITRLQYGLGLPVRDIVPSQACSQFRTALKCKLARPKLAGTNAGGPLLTEINYGELCRLGAEGRSDFHWQFRSQIRDYDRLSRPLQKWLGRLFRWTGDYRKNRSRGWAGGFTAYDELTCKRFTTVSHYDSFVEFGKMCDLLVDELEAARRKD